MYTFQSSFLSIAFLLTMAISAPNLIPTGSFDDGSNSWSLELNPTVPSKTASISFPSTSYNLTSCAKIMVTEPQKEDWFVQLNVPSWSVKQNSIYRLSFMGKGSNSFQISISYGKNVPAPYKEYEYKEGFKFNLTNAWTKYSGEFSSNLEGEGLLEISLNFGEYSGEFSIDDIVLEEIDQIDQWNTWYSDANQRIDTLRKGLIPLTTIIDSSGNHLSQGIARVRLIKHDFPFGTSAIFADSVSQLDNDWYKNKITSIFNSVTIESALKWVDYEPLPDQLKKTELLKYTTFADTNNLLLRGHVLAWALQLYGFENHWSQQLSDQALKDAIKKRITREVTDYKGKISEYDVWNEPFHEASWFTRLQHLNTDKNNYWEHLDSSFHWARSADSSADLYLNEYGIVAGGQTATLLELVRGMLKRNVPITGIGAQCHFENNPIEPELIRKRLDSLAQLGLKIKVTEFDLGTPEEGVLLTEQQMASEYSKFLRTAFSHPAVSGITMWGFWDRLIWNKPQVGAIGSGLYNIDKSPKIAADSVTHLLQKEWSTDTTIDLSSVNTLNGFYGEYSISIKTADSTWSGTFHHTQAKPVNSIIVKNDAAVNIEKIEKKAQRFIAVTDNNARVVAISGAKVEFPTTLQVLDLRGRLVYQYTAERVDSFQFSLNTLPDGMYVVAVKNGQTAIQQKLLLMR